MGPHSDGREGVDRKLQRSQERSCVFFSVCAPAAPDSVKAARMPWPGFPRERDSSMCVPEQLLKARGKVPKKLILGDKYQCCWALASLLSWAHSRVNVTGSEGYKQPPAFPSHHTSGEAVCPSLFFPPAPPPPAPCSTGLVPGLSRFCQAVGMVPDLRVEQGQLGSLWLVSEVMTVLFVTATFGPELIFLFLHLPVAQGCLEGF